MKNVTGLLVLFSWIVLFAEQRFYHKPVTLEARATQIDVQNLHKLQIETIIVDETGKLIKIKVIENNELDHKALEEQMYLWRVRNKYWGRQESIEYLYSVINSTI